MKLLSQIQINVSGVDYTVKAEDVTAETTLNTYLREVLHLTGTKRMCLQGGCGTCIVAVEEVDSNGVKKVFAVNSCLVYVLSCHGWKILSVEGIGSPLKGYHQIQKLLADNNGTQCGFCSPGMVMNMYALAESGPKTKAEIENSFGGNLCRCTGYRPIMTAFYNLASDKVSDIEDLSTCTKKKCTEQCSNACKKKESFNLNVGKSNWMKVYYLRDLLELLRTSGNASYMLVAGNTAQGVIGRPSYSEVYIDVTSVDELTKHTSTETSLILGANINLTKTMEIFKETAKKYSNFGYLSEMVKHIDLVANVPVRNIGTLAGNLMLKHSEPRFQSDIFLILETVRATLVIVDIEANEYRKSPKEFLGIDMKKKVIKEIILRGFDPHEYYYRSYKVMHRAQNNHAIVNAGFLFKLSTEGIVESATIVYGAITTNFVHASQTEAILKGQKLFDNNTLQKAFETLHHEIKPDVNPPDPGPECRKQLAINFFYKFVLSIAPDSIVSPVNKTGGSMLSRPVSSGVQTFSTNKTRYPVSKPTIKLEALAQTAGQTQYIVDRPDLPNQLHACFVTAEATPGSTIVSIDVSEALAMRGVVAFYSAKDIPGVNSITALAFGFPAEEFLCSGQVQYYSQPVGIIVANKHEIAVKGAEMVKISYKESPFKPFLTPKQLLQANQTNRIIHQSSIVPKYSGQASKSIKGEFYIGTQYHFHMETQCCDAIPTEDGMEIWAGTQWIAHTQFAVSQILNMDAQKIDVTVKRLGGAYGGKVLRSSFPAGASALAAYKLRKPVKMWMRLNHNMKAIGKRMPLYTKYEVGVNEKGVIQNMSTELYSDVGYGLGTLPYIYLMMDCFENCYNFDTWTYDTYLARTDTHPNAYTRAPGTLEGLGCIESIMEEIAHSLRLDALDVKIANLDSKKYPKLIQFINEMKREDKLIERMDEIKAYNKANRWRKKGISVVPMKFTLDLMGNYSALVSIYFQNGGVAISHGGVEMGQGINTKVAQTCAYKLGIPIDLISVKASSNITSPNSLGSGGSWTSEAVCLSVIKACDILLERMKPVKDTNPGVTWEQLVKLCFQANINLSTNGFSHRGQKEIQAYPIFGVCAAEVEVDILTGQTIINRVDIIEDVGESISPLIDIGQVEGAFVMGLGYYLMEDIVYSPEGEILNPRTWNYTPPTVKDIPVDFRIRFPSDNPNPVGILQSKATAEPPVCLSVAVPLAIRNALASARTDADSTKPKWFPFIKAEDVTAETSLNTYLREVLHLTGTKRMCLEGGCGTCIVAVEEVDSDGAKKVFAVNSCLVSILSCHGWKIHSVEGIGNPLKGYHQIQKLLADNNGTQCGFCSPGMVMNMYALAESGPKTKAEIENSFGGNLCRCTGYRPIMTAFYNLASDKVSDIEELSTCTQKKCAEHCSNVCKKKESFNLNVGKSNWMKVYYLRDLLELLRTSGNASYMLVAGNTAQGVIWRTTYPEVYIDVTSVDELTQHTSTETSLVLGANINLTKTMEIFKETAKKYPNFGYLLEMTKHIDLVANVPVRNIGTLAGNLMLKHSEPRFQSDIFLILETVRATLVIVDDEANEYRKSPKEFLGIDMKKKVIKEIVLRGFDPRKYHYRSFKVMNRAQNTHAVVNAGFLFKLSTEGYVKSAAIVYGAITTNFVHAPLTEAILKGQKLFDNNTLQKAFKTLNHEIKPDVNPPDPGPECRKQLAINLFYKFVLSIAPDSIVSPVNKSGGSLLSRPVSSGVQTFSTNEAHYPVSKPTVKLEALAQTSGQTQYITDRPDLPNQLHACFVTAEATPGSTIESMDASEALALKGVVAFYSAKDIPGVNSITALSLRFAPEEFLCSGQVQYYSQPVGIIVANKHEIAVKGAELVKISYKESPAKPFLTPKQLVQANQSDRIIHQSSIVPKYSGQASKTIKGEFYIGTQYHFHMETQCCDAIPTEDGMEIWAGTQWIAHTQFAVSQILNMDAQKIDIIVKRLGGAYGAKILRSSFPAGASALAAYKLRKPVKMWMRFNHNMKAIGKRMPLYTKYEVGVDEKGVIQHMSTDLYSDVGIGLGNEGANPFVMDCFENCYNFDTWTYDTYFARTDTHPNAFTRAPGTLEGLGCIESIMEDIAHSLNLDALDVKIANLDSKKYPKVLQFINEMKHEDKLIERMDEIKAYNKANRWKKKGISVVPMKFTLDLMGNYTALVSIYFQNGGVAIAHGSVEMGQGINTKVAQTCAYKLGIPIEMISVKASSNISAPNNFPTGGSWTSEAVCLSVIRACDILLERMKPVKDANPGATWVQLVQLSFLANINLSTNGFVYKDGKDVQEYPIFGVCAAEVEVDILTGQTIINRVDIIEDVGESISPWIDIGQVEGAFVMGLGYYLTEDLVYSPEGEILNSRTWNYTPPTVKDIPVDFRIRFPSDNPNPVGILQSKATAEPPICLSVAVPLAIRNALASARTDADSTKPKWFPFSGPTNVENILLNTLNDCQQYKL